jgi:hypothetical protein
MLFEHKVSGTQRICEAVSPVISTVKEALGATGDYKENDNDMRQANMIGGDKYFHCKANCQAASRGPTGRLSPIRL